MKRVLSAWMAAVVCLWSVCSLAVIPSSAEEVSAATAVEPVAGGLAYQDYAAAYADVPSAGCTLEINAADYTAGEQLSVADAYEGAEGRVLLTQETGYAEWEIDIPQAGLYAISLEYYPIKGNGCAIQRAVHIDGTVPFEEAKWLQFNRTFIDDGDITQDLSGNDVRPTQVEERQWLTSYCKDSEGYFGDRLLFYFTEGRHSLRLESLAEPMALRTVRLESQASTLRSYEQYLAAHQANGAEVVTDALENGVSIVQAEDAYQKSDQTLYPTSDLSSPLNQPYSHDKVKLNTIGGTKWQNPHQWISWQIDVPESGFYTIGLRCKQNFVRDIACARALYLDDEVPFAEAAQIEFSYSEKWSVLRFGGDEPYLFYLEAGTHTVKMEVVLGSMTDILMKTADSLQSLNQVSWDLLTLLGTDPDVNRDYGIQEYMPDSVEELGKQATVLAQVSQQWEALTGSRDSNIAQIDQLVYQLTEMHEDPDRIPEQFQDFRDRLSSFANTVLNAKQQPLLVDYVFVAEQGAELPRANANFFESLWAAVCRFFNSFFNDYDSLSSYEEEDEPITVWIGNGLSGGKDQANALKQLIQQEFTPQYGIPVNLELVPPSTILTAVVSGKGPDVALQINGSDPANYAMRNAVLDLTTFDDFEEVAARFTPEAFTPYTYLDGVYALPETISFPMMFYRKDVLQEMGINIEDIQTWEDLKAVLPIIQRKNMNIAIPSTYYTYATFLYQNGGELYKDGDTLSNLDSKTSLDAFAYFAKFYTSYNLPFTYSFVTRFRTGEMPIGIDNYTTYNLLQISAPEINGQWGMTTVPGTVDENGNLNKSVAISALNTAGCIIMSSTEQPDKCWEFIKWWTDADAQVKYGNELESVMGVGARYNTANLEALQQLPWQAQDKQALMEGLSYARGIREVPGGYLTARSVGFALNTVYNTKEDPRKVLLTYVDQINQEILIKREEFGLD